MRLPKSFSVSGLFVSLMWCTVLGLSLSPSPVAAQLPQARLYALSPTGGQQGTTVDVSVANGADIEETYALLFSHPGITAKNKTAMVNGKAEPVSGQFQVTIDAKVPPGIYDVRTQGLYGISNPRCFVVSDKKEQAEVEPNNTLEQANKVALNSIVNGLSNAATDLDFFKIPVKKGERVVVVCSAQGIDSKLDPTLELYSPEGRLLQYNRNRIGTDPILDFVAAADGEYAVKVYDFLYQGSADYFYRLEVRTGPYIDFILPPAGLAGSTGEYMLYGRNLPGGAASPFKVDGQQLQQLKVSIPWPQNVTSAPTALNVSAVGAGQEGFSYVWNSPAGNANPVMIYTATAQPIAEVEPNDKPEQAQKVTVPSEIYGQFQTRGDIDDFSFEAKANQVFWIDVLGQRIGSNADPYLIVQQVTKDAKGVETVKQLTALDDNTANLKPFAFDTLSNDPTYRLVVPADGTYRVSVRDRYFESRGDPRLVYRLAIRPEKPEYKLFTVVAAPKPADQQTLAEPWELQLRKGETTTLDVLAERRDGFSLPIDVRVEGLPAGVTASPATILPGQSATTLVLSSTDQAAPWGGSIKIVGVHRVDDPAAVQAEATADANLKAAQAALASVQQAGAGLVALAKSASDTAAAVTAATQNKQDPELQKLKQETDKANAAAQAALAAQTAAVAVADKKVKDLTAALAAAKQARATAVKEIAQAAQPGTIVWGRGAGLASETRLARDLTLAVNKEAAPVQILDAPLNLQVSQGSQLLIPAKVAKRNGFDDAIAMAFTGQPANLAVEAKPIPKGKDTELQKLVIAPNVAPGTYQLNLRGQATVSYRRCVEAADKAQKVKEEADKALAAGQAELKKVTDAKAAVDKKLADAQAAAKAIMDQQAKFAQNAAAEVKALADKRKTQLEQLSQQAAATAKLAGEQAAAAKAALDKDAANKSLADANGVAQKLAVDTAAAAKAVAEALEAAQKGGDAEAAKALEAAKQDLAKKLADAQAVVKAATDEQAAVAKTVAAETEKLKPLMAAKTDADAKAAAAAKVATAANVVVFANAQPITITVKPGPATLALTVPNNGSLKQNTKMEVKVVANRLNGFAGPITVSLLLPPGAKGLQAEPVTIPAGKNDATLVVQAAADAPEGALANVVVHGAVDFNGPTTIDQPLAVTITK
ncbi:MAG: PPC domain-containing protein [Planctomycetales bacterium]